MPGYNPLLSMEQIRFCAEECQRQDTGPMAVYRMCEAYAFVAYSPTFGWDEDTLRFLAWAINDPDVHDGYRVLPVSFEGFELAVDAKVVQQAVQSFLDAAENKMFPSAEALYLEFEKIHPFPDGNGRLGAILYNRYKHTMQHPVTPPDFFHEQDTREL